MKKRYLAYVIAPTLGVTLFGASAALAHGGMGGWYGGFGPSATPDQIVSRQQEMFSAEAGLLGLTVDEVKQAWATGKTVRDLAQAHNISDADLQKRMQDAAQARLKTQLQTLVDRGVITEAQADARASFIASHVGKGHGMMMGRHRGWFPL